MNNLILFYIILVLTLVVITCSLHDFLHNKKFIKKLQQGTILQKTYVINELEEYTVQITIIDVGKYYAKIKYSDNSTSILPINTLIEENWKIIN